MSDRAEIGHRYLDYLWNERNEARFLALFSTDPVPVVRHSKVISAVEEYFEYADILFGMVPNLVVTPEFVTAGDHWVTSAFTFSGHGRGRDGERGPAVEFSGSCHLKLDARDRIVEIWNDIDMTRCFLQLGLLPADIFDHCLAQIPVRPFAELA